MALDRLFAEAERLLAVRDGAAASEGARGSGSWANRWTPSAGAGAVASPPRDGMATSRAMFHVKRFRSGKTPDAGR